MSLITSTFITPAGRGNFSGEIYLLDNALTRADRIYLPPYVAAVDRYVSAGKHGNRLYMAGGHTALLMIDEEFRCVRQGMQAPFAPSVAAGAGATPQIAYQRFYDQITGERSPLSEGFSFSGDLNRTWTQIATDEPGSYVVLEGLATFSGTGTVTGDGKANYENLRPGDRIAKASDLTRWGRVKSIVTANSMTIDDIAIAGAAVPLVALTVGRASHVELWLSVSGGLPRLVVRVPLGTTSVTENTATLALGQAEITSFEALPYGTINAIYNRRHFVAGVETHPDTVFVGALDFPERYEGLQLKTLYGEPVIGLLRYRKVLLVQSTSTWYIVTGFSDDDVSMDEFQPGVGGIGHHLNVVDKKGDARIPSDDTIKIFNGGWHDSVPKRISEWSAEVARNRLAYERGFAAYNPKDGTYQIYPRYNALTNATQRAHVWIAHGNAAASAEGGVVAPEWTSDTHALGDGVVTYARYLIPSGARVGKFYRGTSKGEIWEEDETDTVAFDGESIIVPGHLLFGDPGGGYGEGKQLIKLWLYLVSELSGGKIQVWRGDEFCYPPDVLSNGQTNIAVPAWPDTPSTGLITASLLTDARKTWAPETVRAYMIGLQARGFTVEIRLVNPLAAVFMGFGGEWGLPGEIARDIRTDWTDPG